MLGGLDDLEAILMKQPVDERGDCATREILLPEIQTAMQTCERAGIEAHFNLSDIFELSLARPELEAARHSTRGQPQGRAGRLPVVGKTLHRRRRRHRGAGPLRTRS